MRLPRGDLVRSRVVDDPADPLADALDRGLTGYAVLVPQDALLLSAEARGVLTFADGVPVLAYHVETDRGGPAALADLAVPGPYRVDLASLPPAALARAHEADALEVPPGMPAERLAGAPDLADRTRRRAPDERVRRDEAGGADAVAAFLADEEKVEAIAEQAREEARARAAEWGLEDQLVDGPANGGDDPTPEPRD